MINFIFALLILTAACTSLIIIGFLVMWLKGADSIAIPALGLIVATPVFILLLMLVQFVVVIAAIFVARYRTGFPTIMSS